MPVFTELPRGHLPWHRILSVKEKLNEMLVRRKRDNPSVIQNGQRYSMIENEESYKIGGGS
jgi:hypothetical protein